MAAARRFTELLFWKRARQWSKSIFHRTRLDPFARDQRLVVQINDSSESVMSNMAEGFGRSTQEEFITFLGYALGSLDETLSHLCAAYDREYLSKEEFGEFYQEGVEIRKLTVGFIRSMVMPRGGVRTARKQPQWSQRVWEIYGYWQAGTGAVCERHPWKRERRSVVVRKKYRVRSTKYRVRGKKRSFLPGPDL